SSSSSLLSSTPASAVSSAFPGVTWTPAMDVQVMELFTGVVGAVRNRRNPPVQPNEDEDDPDHHMRQRDSSHVHMLDLPLNSRSVVKAMEEDPKLRQQAN